MMNSPLTSHHLGLILDGQCEYCSINFYLKVHYHSGHTLDVISYDLKISNPSVILTNVAQYVESGGYNAFEQRGILTVKLRRGQELRMRVISLPELYLSSSLPVFPISKFLRAISLSVCRFITGASSLIIGASSLTHH
uniref:Uncharacterized protein n=1 Tax=Nelumbo nucifera TaxID=4432 RepID=A0A822ZKQ3_NELNU|nr:TPA_asm: hypothetical protein HUJ06_003697 [Nelumbo nucifera]